MIIDLAMLTPYLIAIVSFLVGHLQLLPQLLSLFTKAKQGQLTLADIEALLQKYLQQPNTPSPKS